MRPELKKLDWHIYGVSAEDFDYTIGLVKEMIAAREAVLEAEAKQVRTEAPAMADDILDDVIYYAHVATEYLWHFCLWILQGIFEGIIVQNYLPEAKRLYGLKAKLDAMRQAGYTLKDSHYEELMDWANLRNALSHAPPERFRPVHMDEADMRQYVGLVTAVLSVWSVERPTKEKLPVEGSRGHETRTP